MSLIYRRDPGVLFHATQESRENMLTEAKKNPALRSLLGSLSVGRFFSDFWESQPVLLTGSKSAVETSSISLDNVEEVLSYTLSGDSHQGLRIVRSDEGKLSHHSVPTDGVGRPDVFSIYRLYYDGWSIVINGIDRRWPPISGFAMDLQRELAQRIGVNLYLTPANAQGLLPHVDGHDVFVLQIEGTKNWEVFGSPTILPLENQKVDTDPAMLGKPLLAEKLSPTQVLYIPRGFIHQAGTGTLSSIHLTIGVHSYKWRDLVRDALEGAEESDSELRQSVPPRMLSSRSGQAAARAKVADLLSAVASEPLFGEAVRKYRKRLVREGHGQPQGQFGEIDRLDSVSLETEVMRRTGLSCFLEESDSEVSISFSGNVVRGPKSVAPAFRFIARRDRFLTKQLPKSLSDSSKVVIVRRLIREGLLRSAR